MKSSTRIPGMPDFSLIVKKKREIEHLREEVKRLSEEVERLKDSLSKNRRNDE